MRPAPSFRPYTEGARAPALWAPPDPALQAAGVEGELVVARVRVAAMALLLLAPTWNLVTAPEEAVHRTGFAVTLGAALVATLIWQVLRRGGWRPWIGFASSALDVSLVTLALVTFLVVSSPLVALNSTVTFEMYFLALVATSLRYDQRICLAVGLLAITQYAALWAYAAARYDLADPRYVAEAGPYSAVDLATRLLLLAVATLLAVTIVRRAQRLLYLAARDRLTGLYNRGHFDRALRAALERAGRDGQPLSLAILDVDHFKRINDVHGHGVGDRALVELAERLDRSMRRTDLVARYGGEEFVILMPATPPEAALFRVESLRREVASRPLRLGDGQSLTLDFSAGVAGLPDDAVTTPKALLDLADGRLLQAKRTGRGRSVGGEK
ncbi:MAG: GGDEF domain-containing protein [Gemmatimonadales bacterium]|jgi:diguanylate cyclase (GGDEF)-like protein|nr:GGDEF domain-containing protein [Gemmatimonadales bacterium]